MEGLACTLRGVWFGLYSIKGVSIVHTFNDMVSPINTEQKGLLRK